MRVSRDRPFYDEEELATNIDPGDRALFNKEAALAASLLKAHPTADKVKVGARQRGSPVRLHWLLSRSVLI
jgi:hypothetical protein